MNTEKQTRFNEIFLNYGGGITSHFHITTKNEINSTKIYNLTYCLNIML